MIAWVGMIWMGCGPSEPDVVAETAPVDLSIPSHISPMPVPDDNPLSEEAFQLGRALFYDSTLSSDRTVSCASCHQQEYAFGDNRALSVGAGGLSTYVNTPPLINLAWAPTLFADGRAGSLEEALSEHIREPNIMAATDGAMDAVREAYALRFKEVFPDQADPSSDASVVKALSTFVRALVSFGAPIDLLKNDEVVLTDKQQRGTDLMEARLNVPDNENLCNRCHERSHGIGDDDGVSSGLFTHKGPRNNGTGSRRVPTVRNSAVTAPYFQDGSAEDFNALLTHYHSGVADAESALVDAAGKPLTPQFSEEELEAFIAMMGLFTDTDFLSNPRFGKP